MVSGALYGGILRLLVKLIDARHVLDLGCFTGYGAVACVEAGALCAVVGRSRSRSVQILPFCRSAGATDVVAVDAFRDEPAGAHARPVTLYLGQAMPVCS